MSRPPFVPDPTKWISANKPSPGPSSLQRPLVDPRFHAHVGIPTPPPSTRRTAKPKNAAIEAASSSAAKSGASASKPTRGPKTSSGTRQIDGFFTPVSGKKDAVSRVREQAKAHEARGSPLARRSRDDNDDARDFFAGLRARPRVPESSSARRSVTPDVRRSATPDIQILDADPQVSPTKPLISSTYIQPSNVMTSRLSHSPAPASSALPPVSPVAGPSRTPRAPPPPTTPVSARGLSPVPASVMERHKRLCGQDEARRKAAKSPWRTDHTPELSAEERAARRKQVREVDKARRRDRADEKEDVDRRVMERIISTKRAKSLVNLSSSSGGRSSSPSLGDGQGYGSALAPLQANTLRRHATAHPVFQQRADPATKGRLPKKASPRKASPKKALSPKMVRISPRKRTPRKLLAVIDEPPLRLVRAELPPSSPPLGPSPPEPQLQTPRARSPVRAAPTAAARQRIATPSQPPQGPVTPRKRKSPHHVVTPPKRRSPQYGHAETLLVFAPPAQPVFQPSSDAQEKLKTPFEWRPVEMEPETLVTWSLGGKSGLMEDMARDEDGTEDDVEVRRAEIVQENDPQPFDNAVDLELGQDALQESFAPSPQSYFPKLLESSPEKTLPPFPPRAAPVKRSTSTSLIIPETAAPVLARQPSSTAPAAAHATDETAPGRSLRKRVSDYAHETLFPAPPRKLARRAGADAEAVTERRAAMQHDAFSSLVYGGESARLDADNDEDGPTRSSPSSSARARPRASNRPTQATQRGSGRAVASRSKRSGGKTGPSEVLGQRQLEAFGYAKKPERKVPAFDGDFEDEDDLDELVFVNVDADDEHTDVLQPSESDGQAEQPRRLGRVPSPPPHPSLRPMGVREAARREAELEALRLTEAATPARQTGHPHARANADADAIATPGPARPPVTPHLSVSGSGDTPMTSSSSLHLDEGVAEWWRAIGE
ncbi:hypothetical protein Q5752_003711 [Cryptotrichosporon argae]